MGQWFSNEIPTAVDLIYVLLFGLIRQQFHLFAILDLVHENFSGLESRDIMLINNNSGVARDVSGYLFLSFLINEASETADIDVLATCHVVFNHTQEGFYGSIHICFVHTGFFCDFVNNICFSHACKGLVLNKQSLPLPKRLRAGRAQS